MLIYGVSWRARHWANGYEETEECAMYSSHVERSSRIEDLYNKPEVRKLWTFETEVDVPTPPSEEKSGIEKLQDLFRSIWGGPPAKELRIYQGGKVQWMDDGGEWHDYDPLQPLLLSSLDEPHP